MKKKVKGGIVKYYCDSCGKLLYDLIPDGMMNLYDNGNAILSYKIRSYVPHRRFKGHDFCSEKCENEYRKLRKSQAMG